MLRELSTVLLELQEALIPLAGGANNQVRLHDASLELPLDMRVVFSDGQPQLQADVPRSLQSWPSAVSTLRIRIEGQPS